MARPMWGQLASISASHCPGSSASGQRLTVSSWACCPRLVVDCLRSLSRAAEKKRDDYAEAESKEKHGVWDPMPELTITSPYVHYRNRLKHIYHGQHYARSTFTICQSRHNPPVRDFGFGRDLKRKGAAKKIVFACWSPTMD
jgi:hypothetical protein